MNQQFTYKEYMDSKKSLNGLYCYKCGRGIALYDMTEGCCIDLTMAISISNHNLYCFQCENPL